MPSAPDFFDSYVKAFERFDVGAIADHFTFPLQVAGDSEPVDLRCVADRDEWLETLTMLIDLYKGFGVQTAAVLESTVTALSDRITHAGMHWSLRDESDQEVYDFHGVYTLIVVDGDLRIAAIAHDELGKIMAKLA
jgi:hypothetical protein